MESSESLRILKGMTYEAASPTTLVSASSLEDERLASKLSVLSHKAHSPDAATARSAFTDDGLDSPCEQTQERMKELEKENGELKGKIRQLESDLAQSKSDVQSANARVSVLVNECTSMKKQLDEYEKQQEKKEPPKRVCSFQGSTLIRQTSTTSDILECASKRSLPSAKSSRQNLIARTQSIPVKPEKTSTPRSLQAILSDEIEAQKLSFAEKLVQKEETIAKLQKQLDYSTSQVRQVEAGIDGVETRFNHELETFKAQTAKKYNSVIQKSQDLMLVTKKTDEGLSALKKEIQKVSTMVSQDMKQLEMNLRKKEQQRIRLVEEKRILRRKFDAKLQESANSEQCVSELKAEIEQQKTVGDGLRSEIQELENKVVFLNSRLADLTILDNEQSSSINNDSSEIQTLNNRISSLEEGLAEYESKNRHLIKELEDAHSKLEELDTPEEMDIIEKENKELKQEIVEVSEKLVDLEQENNALREEREQLSDVLSKCAVLEDEVEGLNKAKEELNGHLARRKRHVDELQGELKELRLAVQNEQTDLSFDSYASHETASTQVTAVFKAEKRCEELEQIVADLQFERDQLADDRSSKNKKMHTLLNENKKMAAALKKEQKQSGKFSEKLEEAKAEIATLQGTICANASSRSSSKSRYNDESEVEITQELVNAKICLAENDGRILSLRRDLHKSMARNAVLNAKTSRLETLLREVKQEKGGGFIRRKTTKSIRFS